MRSQIARLPHFGPGIARTTPPPATIFAKIANSEPRNTSETSAISIGMRRSGLSVPYFSIDSRYGMRGNGSGTRSEEHTYELQSLMRISYAGFCFKKKKHKKTH